MVPDGVPPFPPGDEEGESGEREKAAAEVLGSLDLYGFEPPFIRPAPPIINPLPSMPLTSTPLGPCLMLHALLHLHRLGNWACNL